MCVCGGGGGGGGGGGNVNETVHIIVYFLFHLLLLLSIWSMADNRISFKDEENILNCTVLNGYSFFA